MAKLYVFGIGGTGARILNSLTMLLASGIEIDQKFDEIVPMLIDTDENNGNLVDLKNAIIKYNRIHKSTYYGVTNDKKRGQFFRVKIRKPSHLTIKSATAKNISELIKYDILINKSPQNRALVDLLFDEEIRNNELENGFLGNPNIGTVVLRDIINSDEFKNFTNKIGIEDRIFLINSIFGGTGAAGYPLLLKVFRDKNNGLNNSKILNDIIIGGLTVLPYFSVGVTAYNEGDSVIQSNTFLTKTKAALGYYNENILSEINALYYIADNKKSAFANHEGGVKQRNPSHFIEVAGASAILDFSKHQISSKNIKDLDPEHEYYCFGIKDDQPILDFTSLIDSDAKHSFSKPLIMFNYFGVYLTNFLTSAVKDTKMAWINNLNFSQDFFSVGRDNNIINNMRDFFEHHFFPWLNDLQIENKNKQSHQRKFMPYNMQYKATKTSLGKKAEVIVNNKKELANLVTNIPAKEIKSGLFRSIQDIEINEFLNDISDNEDVLKNSPDNSKKFMSLFFGAMENLYSERFLTN